MSDWRNWLALVIVVLYVSYQWYTDRQHNQFFEEMRGFADRGDRFTSEDGRYLQRQIEQQRTLMRSHLEHSARYTERIVAQHKVLADLEARVRALEASKNGGRSFQ